MNESTYVVTFEHNNERFNVWVWPDEAHDVDEPFAAEVNVKRGIDGWTPLDSRQIGLTLETQ